MREKSAESGALSIYDREVFSIGAGAFGEKVSETIPHKSSPTPNQFNKLRLSPTRKTPRSAATNGSANDSDTAVDDGTDRRPLLKSK